MRKAFTTPGAGASRLFGPIAYYRSLAGILGRTLPRHHSEAAPGRLSRVESSPSFAFLKAFLGDDAAEEWGRLLRFLTPITIAGGLAIEVLDIPPARRRCASTSRGPQSAGLSVASNPFARRR